MKIDLDSIKPENYIRTFAFDKLPYLIIDCDMLYDRDFDFLAVYNGQTAVQFIGNAQADRTSRLGQALFDNDKNFKNFETNYRKWLVDIEEYIRSHKSDGQITLDDFFDFKAFLWKTYYYFRKTEFFYTDILYYGKMSEVAKRNLFILGDDLKFKGRPLFIELVTTILYRFGELIAKQQGIDSDLIKSYSFDELQLLLETGEKVDDSILLERQRSYVIVTQGGAMQEITGDEKAVILERFKEPDYSTVTELKGTIANKGKVTGRVTVIIPRLDIPYDDWLKELYAIPFNDGDILLTETTSPDFVPLMKRASGIIADQGGMNSHAAIMSRELGVPCLVGTYHATHVFTTGDLVELDANTGVVKIIKKVQK
ncbi:MAG: PEP-utilizing enzyme [Candidatus Paceibacterota bacterium]|jgi:phosphohistidine swiveling domain-containing protein